MSQPRLLPALSLASLFLLLPGLMSAQPRPSIRLTNPPSPAFETDAASIDLQGAARLESAPKNVLWVDQFGRRGSGSWSSIDSSNAAWSLPDVPLRLGINLITVTVVDASNHSQSLHLAVNRKPAPGAAPRQSREIRSGMWHNQPILYQTWNGQMVVEGDMILGPESSHSETPQPSGLKPHGLSISYLSQLWPVVNGVHQVPYIITGASDNLTTALATYNQTFSGLIQFVPQSTETNYVNITVEPGGSGEGLSNVGMIGGPQILQCGSGCAVSTWLHEMGHTTGLFHEQQRPDRASYVTLNLANADLPNVPNNFTLFSYDYQMIGLYDDASVMQYGSFDFSKAGLPVIESIPAGIPLGNNAGYSAGDVDTVKRLYGATPSAVTVTTNPPGLSIVVDNTTYTAPHSFNWALNSIHTLSLPAAPQTTNPSDGSTYVFGEWNDLGRGMHTVTVAPGTGTLASPASAPAVTMYEANFVRLQPFAFLSPAVYPSGAGTVTVSPQPTSEYGGTFFVDRTLVTLTLTPTQGSGYNFYDWFNLPYPPSDNPHSFYIQAPTTQAQAVFVPTPVSIVGESITGPHTWNPGIAGYVDGYFYFLPTGFSSYYDGSAWNAGTTHSVSADQQQSPVTTNVFYNWNSWSDSGAITHNIVQPSAGSQTITASFTPFYASYTVPAPLGTANAVCYGGVTTSPAGIVYPYSIFNFYEDGASVTATASPNPEFPSMLFAGWSATTGGLTGSANPQITTIHDQFVPTANFNLTSAPLAVTTFSPSTAIAGPNALDITVIGTGFTSADTYAYWNYSYRAITYVSPTEVIVHLNAGDLANAGAQDLSIGNFTSGNSNSNCGLTADTSFTVTTPGAAGPPTGVSVTPSSGSGSPQKFTMIYTDPSGVSDFKNVDVIINASKSTTSACAVVYTPNGNKMYLYNDNGTLNTTGVTPGSSASVSNSQCTLSGTGSTVSVSGNDLSLKIALTFTAAFTGKKYVYLAATGKTSASGYVAKGSWTP